MKRLVLALAAAATMAGPMLAASDAAAQTYRSDRYERRDYDRHDRRDYDRRDYDRRDYDRRDYRSNDRYDRYDNNRWDSRRYNGYYLGSRWYYGQPSVSYYSRRDYRPAYRAWTRGSYLPRDYWGYRVSDYRHYRLRQPPRGYHWVRVNNDYVLAAIATGLIADVILNNGY